MRWQRGGDKVAAGLGPSPVNEGIGVADRHARVGVAPHVVAVGRHVRCRERQQVLGAVVHRDGCDAAGRPVVVRVTVPAAVVVVGWMLAVLKELSARRGW